MVMTGISVVIPVHPARLYNGMLTRAIMSSLYEQTLKPDTLHIELDTSREGSAVTRTRGLMHVSTEWTAFLDSDDEFMSHHLSTLVDNTSDDVDVIYTGCEVRDPNGNSVPLIDEWGRFGKEFDPKLLNEMSYLPVTSLVRTNLAQEVGGFAFEDGSPYDDWTFYKRMLFSGAKFIHVPEVTWVWNHHGLNTSGSPLKGDAR